MLNDDNIQESSESFNLTISSTSLPKEVHVGNPNHAVVTIEDEDGKYNCYPYYIL